MGRVNLFAEKAAIFSHLCSLASYLFSMYTQIIHLSSCVCVCARARTYLCGIVGYRYIIRYIETIERSWKITKVNYNRYNWPKPIRIVVKDF